MGACESSARPKNTNTVAGSTRVIRRFRVLGYSPDLSFSTQSNEAGIPHCRLLSLLLLPQGIGDFTVVIFVIGILLRFASLRLGRVHRSWTRA